MPLGDCQQLVMSNEGNLLCPTQANRSHRCKQPVHIDEMWTEWSGNGARSTKCVPFWGKYAYPCNPQTLWNQRLQRLSKTVWCFNHIVRAYRSHQPMTVSLYRGNTSAIQIPDTALPVLQNSGFELRQGPWHCSCVLTPFANTDCWAEEKISFSENHITFLLMAEEERRNRFRIYVRQHILIAAQRPERSNSHEAIPVGAFALLNHITGSIQPFPGLLIQRIPASEDKHTMAV